MASAATSSVILQQQRISEAERRGAVVDDLDRRRDILHEDA
jgi:hypothetical protein